MRGYAGFATWARTVPEDVNPIRLFIDGDRSVRAKFSTPAAPPSGLVGFWRGDTDATDTIGGHNGAFYIGSSPTTPAVTPIGKVGAAFEFTGTQHIRIPDTAALRPAQVTLEAWILPVAFSSGFQSMIARGSSFGAAGAWKLGLQNGVPWFQVSVPGGGVIVQRPGPSVQLPLNRWTHIAGTFDGAIARLYLNGTSVAERRVAGDLSYEANPIPVTIAADTVNNAPDGLFIGRIDEVSLYRRALTAAEIVDIVVADFLGKSVARPYFTSERRLPNAVSGTAYSHQVVTILGAGPVTFRLSSGAMPPGVTLSSTGAISGTPGYPGRWGFTVVATDSSGQSTAQLFVLEVQ